MVVTQDRRLAYQASNLVLLFWRRICQSLAIHSYISLSKYGSTHLWHENQHFMSSYEHSHSKPQSTPSVGSRGPSSSSSSKCGSRQKKHYSQQKRSSGSQPQRQSILSTSSSGLSPS